MTTAVVNIALQVAANHNFKTYAADLKNAFAQSGRLVRESGKFFCRQPKGGLYLDSNHHRIGARVSGARFWNWATSLV